MNITLPTIGQAGGWGLLLNNAITTLKTAVEGLAAVATSGSYSDLGDKPTIPAATTSASALTSGTLDVARLAADSVTAVKLAPAVRTSLAKADGSATYPAGGTDGQSLVKSGSTTTWATVTGGGSATTDASALTTGTLPNARLSQVPSTVLATAVQASLGKADTALQTAPVSSVAGKTGTVSLTKSDVGLGNVDNTADTAKPVSTAQQTALNTKIGLSSARPVVRLGVFPESANPTSEAEYVAASGEPVTMMLVPYNYTQQPDTAALTALNARGVEPSITWMPNGATEGTNNPNYQLADILAGTYDAYMTTFLNSLKGLGFPMVMKWGPEMNGDWAAWSEGQNGNTTGQYAQTWRYIWNLAKTLNVTNLEWQWAPTSKFVSSTPLAGLYPGAAYVDSIAVHGYNYGTGGPDGVRSMSTIFDATFNEIAAFGRGKPMWLGETGARDTAGDKPAWIADFFDWVIARGIAGFVWYNSSTITTENYDWRVNSSPATTAAWTAGMAKLRKVAQPSGKAVAQGDGPNNWTGRQNFYGAEVVGLPAAALPTPDQIGAAPATLTNNFFTADTTLAIWNAGRRMLFDTTVAVTATIPTNASVAFPVGTDIPILQMGTGQLTLAAASGVTLNSRGGVLKLAGRYGAAGVLKTDTNTWVAYGDLVA